MSGTTEPYKFYKFMLFYPIIIINTRRIPNTPTQLFKFKSKLIYVCIPYFNNFYNIITSTKRNIIY